MSSTGRLSDDKLACGRMLGKRIARCIRSIFHHEDDMLMVYFTSKLLDTAVVFEVRGG